MISCTEFIPLYSEFFRYLDENKGGHDAVVEYWCHISDNSIGDKSNPNSLISFIERDGPYFGAVNYWNHTLTEEACDVLKIHDYKNHCTYSHMRHCPSRGMLNALKHIEPYYDYCGHCNLIYSRVLEKYGMRFDRDHSKIDNAECMSYLYDAAIGIPEDAAEINDSKVVVDMKPEDNKYLHRDFHLLGDLALKYCGDKYGKDEVISFLAAYVKNYYAPQIEDIRSRGLTAIKEWIESVYEKEEALDVLHMELTNDRLTVTIDKSPVIEYMRSLGQKPSEYYIEETRTLYAVIAESCGLGFVLDYYNEDGGTRFSFTK